MATINWAPERASGVADSEVPRHRRRRPGRRLVPVLGVAGVLLTMTGLGGIGDAPAPYDTAASMATHFQLVRDDVLLAAPIGILGAAALGAFLLALARRLRVAGEPGAAAAVVSGGSIAVGYLLFLHVAYASLVYQIAQTSPEATKALFIVTILAMPVVGLGIAVTLGGAAYGAGRAGLLPRWWSVSGVVAAAFAAIAIFSYAAEDFFSPDVQQQTAFGAFVVWVLVTAGALFVRDRRS